ncbi:hypothetical protein ES708_34258 [subsurface metagenome]
MLLFGQRIGGSHEQGDQLIAPPPSPQVGNPLSFELKYLPGLRAGRYLELGVAVEGGQLHLGAQRRLSKIDG